jgi:hypothetical protein
MECVRDELRLSSQQQLPIHREVVPLLNGLLDRDRWRNEVVIGRIPTIFVNVSAVPS